MFGCESDTSIAFLVHLCNFIIKDEKVLGAGDLWATMSFYLDVFLILRPCPTYSVDGRCVRDVRRYRGKRQAKD